MAPGPGSPGAVGPAIRCPRRSCSSLPPCCVAQVQQQWPQVDALEHGAVCVHLHETFLVQDIRPAVGHQVAHGRLVEEDHATAGNQAPW
ncbi:hypothetical protein ACFFX0_07285 [Citricoccus parietis]|uniref:Uncharacterized protein n=1 Tax=Citricoccus parietis TaxID=592307 RepID=A0ABV5FWF1_9MICC